MIDKFINRIKIYISFNIRYLYVCGNKYFFYFTTNFLEILKKF